MAYLLTAKWQHLILANYEIEPSILLPYLPQGTSLDFYEGKTFVSLVAFLFADSRILGIPFPVFGTFEEINLRFYVTRNENGVIKRGVVFIRESIKYKAMALAANTLFHEKYNTLKTKHEWNFNGHEKKISYSWLKDKKWNHFKVQAGVEELDIPAGSFEEFIMEHYYGYTKLDVNKTQEYGVLHDRWTTNQVKHVDLYCDYKAMYGEDFAFLSAIKPHSILSVTGAPVAIPWKMKHNFS